MITKFKTIKNLAVFRDFNWDSEVVKPDGSVIEFNHINILYGRNYSGKTTLSRILRAMETGTISDKYENPEFSVQFDDSSEIDQTNYQSNPILVRVFNEDFVRDNLKFITNPDDNIEPFALIGDDNIKLEGEIETLNNEIGSATEGAETGLRAKLVIAEADKKAANTAHQNASSTLERQLGEKATGRGNGIKYNSARFGDQNYTKPKLKMDISLVQAAEYAPLTDTRIIEHEDLIREKAKLPIPTLSESALTFDKLSAEVELLVTKKVGTSDKIEELVIDAILNRWVKDGKELHKEKRENCAFCGNTIEKARWAQLDKHFDEESELLERDIDVLVLKIEKEEKTIDEGFSVDSNLFYRRFHEKLNALLAEYATSSKLYLEALESLNSQLKERKANIINAKKFVENVNHSGKLQAIWTNYEELRTESNTFTNQVGKEQLKSKESLRLHEVHSFASTIKYEEQLTNIEQLKDKLGRKSEIRDKIANSIRGKLALIETKKRQMNDEEKGAIKVNEYLNHFFGHKFLSLEAKESDDGESGNKCIRFEVIRDGKKAYHLSEGECSLLAFCYFLARLEDVETSGTKPIIWIDDPISSLDANHIFFAFSLLHDKIVSQGCFKQLFVSTHNLDFLKYLKRLNGKFQNHNQNLQSYEKRFFVVERAWNDSSIKVMPDYLKEYVTEFNYLFHQIYKCSQMEFVTDANYQAFYNFPNNARKFLEIFLYYKYPHGTKDRNGTIQLENLTKFFRNRPIPAVLTNRINNEYSHLAGCFERGANPIEVPEMKQVASLIIDRLREDPYQFKAFLSSIGEIEAEENTLEALT